MAAIEPIIEVKNLTFGYDDREVLSDVSLNIIPGEFTVFLGRNGSGKSTLLRLMAGLVPYERGSVRLGGKEVARMSYKERARRLAFLAQKHKAVFPFTVEEVVMTGRAAHVSYLPSEHDKRIAQEAICNTGIEALHGRIYTELSGGEQQLVMIARTLAQQPEVILLDEPVSHLDYNNQIRIIGLVRELVSRGMTIVAVIHDPNLAFLFGDRFVYFHDRKIHEVKDGKAWDHHLAGNVFHDNIVTLEHEGRRLFVPQLS